MMYWMISYTFMPAAGCQSKASFIEELKATSNTILAANEDLRAQLRRCQEDNRRLLARQDEAQEEAASSQAALEAERRLLHRFQGLLDRGMSRLVAEHESVCVEHTAAQSRNTQDRNNLEARLRNSESKARRLEQSFRDAEASRRKAVAEAERHLGADYARQHGDFFRILCDYRISRGRARIIRRAVRFFDENYMRTPGARDRGPEPNCLSLLRELNEFRLDFEDADQRIYDCETDLRNVRRQRDDAYHQRDSTYHQRRVAYDDRNDACHARDIINDERDVALKERDNACYARDNACCERDDACYERDYLRHANANLHGQLQRALAYQGLPPTRPASQRAPFRPGLHHRIAWYH